jgi:AcrR family transcriptional regulator
MHSGVEMQHMDKDNGTASSPDTRQALIDAALQAIVDGGEESIRVAQLARSVGLTTGAVYGHFSDKNELIAAAHAEAVRRVIADVTQAYIHTSVSEDDPSEPDPAHLGLRKTIFSPEGRAARRQWAEALLLAARDQQLSKEVSPYVRQVVDLVAVSIKEEQVAGNSVPGLEPRAVAALVISASLGFATLSVAYEDDDEFIEAVGQAWPYLLKGFRPALTVND